MISNSKAGVECKKVTWQSLYSLENKGGDVRAHLALQDSITITIIKVGLESITLVFCVCMIYPEGLTQRLWRSYCVQNPPVLHWYSWASVFWPVESHGDKLGEIRHTGLSKGTKMLGRSSDWLYPNSLDKRWRERKIQSGFENSVYCGLNQ